VHKAAQPAFYFKTLAPLNFSHLDSWQNTATSFQERPLGDLSQLNQLHEASPEQAIERLVMARPNEFEFLLSQQVRAGQQAARQLLHQPQLEPDPVQRALKMSRARHGLPWWFYEAYYRRLRFL
jgi:hypothetical protein